MSSQEITKENILCHLRHIENLTKILYNSIESKEAVIEIQRKQIAGLEEGIRDFEKQIKELEND